MADGVADHHRLGGVAVGVVEVGYEVKNVEGEPADAEDHGDAAEEGVGALEAATAELAAAFLGGLVTADEAGGETVAELVRNAQVGGLKKREC
mgnify:FL=1